MEKPQAPSKKKEQEVEDEFDSYKVESIQQNDKNNANLDSLIDVDFENQRYLSP